ncbi:Spy/CpxP family protein refolding chaperone [Methylosinus sp. Sm6]|uniref:Spy/CpxP family protein refolding chaperone n=1 Tax=Methylosinus sp. Sm6 TaxID=2866948 RepID=UPI001C9935D7|nr:Spy/CpxP family protein refolding chaperone [Methylosinus sp. Sm6]MBY6241046.1 Spy/CpxP family protein refolding chaperone [Methylosinus sp. Sm6]
MSAISNRKWTAATAALLLALGGTAAAQQWGAAPGATDHSASGHDHSSGGADQGGGEHGGMGHGGMGHGGMGGCGMGHGGMSHGDAAKGADGEPKREGQDKHGGMMMRRLCGAGEHIEGRLAYLKAELQLTGAQAPQWTAFADAYRAAGQKVAQYCAAAKDHKMPSGVLEQFGMMERNMTAHLDSVRAIKSAAEPLFTVLTDEQRKTAEEVMTGEMGLGTGGMGKL